MLLYELQFEIGETNQDILVILFRLSQLNEVCLNMELTWNLSFTEFRSLLNLVVDLVE